MPLPLAHQLIVNGIIYIFTGLLLALLLIALTYLILHCWYKLSYYCTLLQTKYLLYQLRKEFRKSKVPPKVVDQYMMSMNQLITKLAKK